MVTTDVVQIDTRGPSAVVSKPAARGRNDHSYVKTCEARKRPASVCTSAAAVKHQHMPVQDVINSDNDDIAGIFHYHLVQLTYR